MQLKSQSISVVIPTFNRASFLPRALDSVLNQTLTPKEIVICDNNSTDDTEKLIKKKYPYCKYILEKKRGVSIARNTAILKTSGEWVAFLDSDDEWHPQKLAKQIDAYLSDGQKRRVIHTDEIWYRNGGHLNQRNKHAKRGGDIFQKCLELCCVSPSSSIVKREVFESIGYFDEDLEVCEDYDFWLRVSAQEHILFVPEALTFKHGGHQDQLSKKYWGMDRFRIRAIENLISSKKLDKVQQDMAYLSIISKLGILINGARKRGNEAVLNYYSMKLMQWHREAHFNFNGQYFSR